MCNKFFVTVAMCCIASMIIFLIFDKWSGIGEEFVYVISVFIVYTYLFDYAINKWL